MSKLIIKNSINFLKVSFVLVIISVCLKLLKFQNAELILNVSISLSIISLITILIRYKMIKDQKDMEMNLKHINHKF